MAERQSLQQAVAEAAREQEADIKALVAALSGEEGVQASEPEAQGRASATPESSEGGRSDARRTEPQGASEAAKGTDVVPERYFDVDLSDIEPERRRSIIDSLKERDRLIGRLMQREAELRQALEAAGEAPPPGVAPVPPQQGTSTEELSDEDILAAFGVSKDDPLYEVKAEVMLPIAREILALKDAVEQTSLEREVEEALDYWNSTLDALEAEFGALPVSREVLMEYAAERGIYDPAAAYHAVTASARRIVAEEAAKARAEALQAVKRSQAGGVRPRTADVEPKRTVEAKNLRDAVKQAMALAEEEVGVKLADLIATGESLT